jgi:hypothetical protein
MSLLWYFGQTGLGTRQSCVALSLGKHCEGFLIRHIPHLTPFRSGSAALRALDVSQGISFLDEAFIILEMWINFFRNKPAKVYWGKLGYLPTTVYEWCDGPGCQFKCAEAFAEVSDSKTELDYDVIPASF